MLVPDNLPLMAKLKSLREDLVEVRGLRKDLRALRELHKDGGGISQLREEIAALRQRDDSMLCPVCLGTFDDYVRYRKRKRARCPRCAAAERHRLSWLFLKDRTTLFKQPTRMLHFAPEPIFQSKIQIYMNVDYTPASYDPEKPDEGVDIQNLAFEDASFDLIYCSHVLEHVPDDRKAMRELVRVLAPDGLAVIMVPQRNTPETYEDWSIDTPEGREEAFGQWDHLRWYGRDFTDRLQEAGFAVEIVYQNEYYSPEQQRRYGLRPEPIYACTRR